MTLEEMYYNYVEEEADEYYDFVEQFDPMILPDEELEEFIDSKLCIWDTYCE